MKSTVPFIDLKLQHQSVASEIRRAMDGIFASQRFVMGPCVDSLEKNIARRLKSRHGIGLASGTDALYLALLAMGVGPGDEVLTTPFTFFATASSVARTGARPVFADIHPRTFNLDPERLAAKITPKTRAILPVHLFGLPCDMDPILSLAKKRGLFVLEDVAQALGAEYKGKPAGSMGEAAALSFYPTKNLGGAGDGGMAVTSSDKFAERIKRLRDHGQVKKYVHAEIGFNSRLDEIQAAVVGIKLKRLDSWNRARRRHAADYDKAFEELPLETPWVPKKYTHIYHLYSVLTEKRDELAAHLGRSGVGAGVYYPLPLHLQPCFKSLGYRSGDFPVAESVSKRILSLPMYAELTSGQKVRVIVSVRRFFGTQRK